MRRFSRAVFIAVFLFGWVLPTWSQTPKVQELIREGDHQALAQYYRVEAQSLKEAAGEHEKMGKLYQKDYDHYKDLGQTMAHHCENLRLQALQASYQYEALAREEEQLAKTK